MQFKEKFVKYLTEGIPVHIPEDEVFIFYRELKDFIDKTDNKFMAFYEEGENKLTISDISKDYLYVSYEDDKIIFRQPLHANILESQENILIAGQAFLGVVIFIESITPSEDSNFISAKHNDQWKF
mgnify:FL=1|tara:strand:+ start:147 stop:524 length:378 start_codon:yes stop_codon:yes gene_type:complete